MEQIKPGIRLGDDNEEAKDVDFTDGGLLADGDALMDKLIKCDTSFAVELGPLVDTSKSDSANVR